jgi:hypothetical protein
MTILRPALFAIALFAIACSASAETIVIDCKVSHSTTGGIGKTYTDAERDKPSLHERFAFNVSRGRGCIVVGDACDEKMGRLYVEQDESTVTARGKNPPVMLAYGFIRRAFFLLVGDDSTYSERNDCHEIQLNVVMP